jgi:hypothetical protein
MDYLDNPERRSAARPSDDTSANSYGFAVASTMQWKASLMPPLSARQSVNASDGWLCTSF